MPKKKETLPTQKQIKEWKEKAAKWDALDEKINRFYFDEDDNELPDSDGGDLVDIGEAAAMAFGYHNPSKPVKSMDVFCKFIIEGDALIIGKVTYHHQLVNNKEDVKGGGWFRCAKDDRHLILYGDSFDFGKAKFEDIKSCVEARKVYDSKFHLDIRPDFRYSYDTGTEIIPLSTYKE